MNYPRTNYEMTEQDLKEILDACKPVPYIVVGGRGPASPQESANRAWQRLSERMGFDYMTVQPQEGKSNRFFTAIPSETKEQMKERLEIEKRKQRAQEIIDLTDQISELNQKLKRLQEEEQHANLQPTESEGT